MTYPLVSDIIQIQAFYEFLRDKGNSHKMADMLAFRQPPRARTDREFFEGFGTLDKQFSGDEKVRDHIIGVARRHGYKPNCNDVYLGALARFPGDPDAFVSATGGRGHIQAVCEKRGWECDGTVQTKRREPEEVPKNKALGDDIIARKMAQAMKKDPQQDRGELRHDIIKKHGFTKDRK